MLFYCLGSVSVPAETGEFESEFIPDRFHDELFFQTKMEGLLMQVAKVSNGKLWQWELFQQGANFYMRIGGADEATRLGWDRNGKYLESRFGGFRAYPCPLPNNIPEEITDPNKNGFFYLGLRRI